MSTSPSFLPPPPKRGPGVRRLNSLPLYGFIAICVLAGIVMLYTFYQRGQVKAAAAAAANSARLTSGHATVLDDAPTNGVIQAKLGIGRQTLPPPSTPGTPPPASAPGTPASSPGTAQNEDAATKARRTAWDRYYEAFADAKRRKDEAAAQALTASPVVSSSPAGSVQLSSAGQGQGMQADPGAGAVPPGFGGPILPDSTGAREKQAFMAQRGSDGSNDTVLGFVRNPISPYVVTAGDIVPFVMQGGADSDSPGDLTARVASDVCDSATGSFLLIPANSKLVGNYDSVVSAGQSRLPSVLTRIIFPDGSSVSVGAMPATDQGGYAGLEDQVNRHLWEKFGNSLLVGIAAAGIQLSQPQSRGNNSYDSQQIIAGGLGQQFGQLGQEIARSGLAIPNTVRIRPGVRGGMEMTKDLVLRPYVDSRTSAQVASNCHPADGSSTLVRQVYSGPFVR